MQIEVDFEVFKALTALRESESDSYSDVIKRLIRVVPNHFSQANALSGAAGESPSPPVLNAMLNFKENAFSQGRNALLGYKEGFASRGLLLPNGTQLRAVYKGVPFFAEIREGCWIDLDGKQHSSPSAAASDITGNNVNGLRFWEAKRPGDENWYRLETLAAGFS